MIGEMDLTQIIIDGVLNGIRSKGEKVQKNRWYDLLKSELTFPFKAKIEDFEGGDLEWKDDVVVMKLDNFVDLYGVLVKIKKNNQKYIFPLCGLKIKNKKSKNYLLINAFYEWNDNR